MHQITRRLAAVLLACAPAAHAACPLDAEVDALLEAWRTHAPAEGYGDELSPDDARCAQDKLVARLRPLLGESVGYKVGLSNPAVQRQFSAEAPVYGVLLKDMLLPAGAKVPAAFGARPLFEADLLVRIGELAINTASTPLEAAAAIDALIPFIELPDLVVSPGTKLDANQITAINVGARLGVTGKPIPMRADPAFVDALAAMRVVLEDDSGEISRAEGRVVLDHPLNAVLWLARELGRRGERLEPGQLVSLGSFSKLFPAKPGPVKLRYEGLPGVGTPEVGLVLE